MNSLIVLFKVKPGSLQLQMHWVLNLALSETLRGNMAKKKKTTQKIQKPLPQLNQLISDVEGLEKLQVMQLQLIREIRSQLTEYQTESLGRGAAFSKQMEVNQT